MMDTTARRLLHTLHYVFHYQGLPKAPYAHYHGPGVWYLRMCIYGVHGFSEFRGHIKGEHVQQAAQRQYDGRQGRLTLVSRLHQVDSQGINSDQPQRQASTFRATRGLHRRVNRTHQCV